MLANVTSSAETGVVEPELDPDPPNLEKMEPNLELDFFAGAAAAPVEAETGEAVGVMEGVPDKYEAGELDRGRTPSEALWEMVGRGDAIEGDAVEVRRWGACVWMYA